VAPDAWQGKPLSENGDTNDRSTKGEVITFGQDINFEVERGEILGL
jgi:hypothetical protein